MLTNFLLLIWYSEARSYKLKIQGGICAIQKNSSSIP